MFKLELSYFFIVQIETKVISNYFVQIILMNCKQKSISRRSSRNKLRFSSGTPGMLECKDTSAREETLILSVPTRTAERSPIRFLQCDRVADSCTSKSCILHLLSKFSNVLNLKLSPRFKQRILLLSNALKNIQNGNSLISDIYNVPNLYYFIFQDSA